MSDVERITVKADSDVMAAWQDLLGKPIANDPNLPTCRELAERWGLSEATMRRRLHELVAKGECTQETGMRPRVGGSMMPVPVFRIARERAKGKKR